MAIPIHLQQFKAAGIYRVVFDKSTMLNIDTQVLRLVVGYSEKGPFNIPVYVKDTSEFIQYFGGINRKLERRGVYFHRLALQMLQRTPIIALNLKKFAGETVDGSTITTKFFTDKAFDPISTVELNVEDIYDTTRFWELNAEKLNDLTAINGHKLDQYINLAMTDTDSTSISYFIRKANGSKVSGYNITVNDWYSDKQDELPEWLENHKFSLISDFMAEIYVFRGKFTAEQVLASDTLKNYFLVDADGTLRLRPYVLNAYGDAVDTLDVLYNDDTANPVGHWIGSLIPYFQNKQGQYASLDILFNTDRDLHKCMMSFNVDLLDDTDNIDIDISGKNNITDDVLKNCFNREQNSTVLGNIEAPVITDTVTFNNTVTVPYTTKELKLKGGDYQVLGEYYEDVKHLVAGSVVYLAKYAFDESSIEKSGKMSGTFTVAEADNSKIVLKQVYGLYLEDYEEADPEDETKTITKRRVAQDEKQVTLKWAEGVTEKSKADVLERIQGAVYEGISPAFGTDVEPDCVGPEQIISSVGNVKKTGDDTYEIPANVKFNLVNAPVGVVTEYNLPDGLEEHVYGTSLSFISLGDNWEIDDAYVQGDGIKKVVIKSYEKYDRSLSSIINIGDQFVGVNEDENGKREVVYVHDVYVDTNTNKDAYDTKGNLKYVDVEMGEAGMATFWSDEDLDFTSVKVKNGENYEAAEDALKAYIMIGYKEEGEGTDAITKMIYHFVELKKVPKKTPVILFGAQGEYKVPVSENKLNTLPDGFNLLEGAFEDKTFEDAAGIYVLSNNEWAEATNGTTVPKYQAWITLDVEKYSGLEEESIPAEFFEHSELTEAQVNNAIKNLETNVGVIVLSGVPYQFDDDNEGGLEYVVRIDNPLNQEIGIIVPEYLRGYTYKNDRPAGTGMGAKVTWQEFILSALVEYKGLRTGLLNTSEIDYRYVIDTFESFPVSGLKKELSYLCAQKQSAFCIANFPSVKSFVKCPYTSFTDSKGVFNVDYVVKGHNKKKPAARVFSLPSEVEGASFVGFYTPLKFSDGYIDMIIPSAGLVSNLFIDKYMSRQPYYIVAGPNYGAINASGLVGPDYKYTQDELQIIEPFGVNCMIYKPSFGTFINANQTAKQTPLSALSRINVRELVIYLQDEIAKVLQSYQWEFNNARTRNAILDKANQICALITSNGGIQSYQNIMDESNNTPEIIDNEMAVLSTMIEPGFGCGKMVHELTLYRTGQMSSSIVE